MDQNDKEFKEGVERRFTLIEMLQNTRPDLSLDDCYNIAWDAEEALAEEQLRLKNKE